MIQRRKFIVEFKTQMVLDLVSGAKSAAELCRQHQLNPQLLARWKTEFLESAPLIFEQEHLHNQERIAESERLVGRLTMQLEIAKKSLSALELSTEQKRTVMQMLAEQYPIMQVYGVLDCARSTYYHRAV